MKGFLECRLLRRPLLELSQNDLSFDKTPIGQSNEKVISIKNYGNASTTINSFEFDNSAFTTSTQVGQLQLNTEQQISVLFSPSSEGEFTGILTIRTASGDLTIALSGQGDFAECSTAVEITGENSFCPGGSTVISATGGFSSYEWYKDDELIVGQSSKDLEVDEDGIYRVRAV